MVGCGLSLLMFVDGCVLAIVVLCQLFVVVVRRSTFACFVVVCPLSLFIGYRAVCIVRCAVCVV